MKVQLVVVQGKPEGKVIPLTGPMFRIGRGETCHLRPNSEQVSREHAEFTISGDTVVVRDLGSRNGTLVNGKAITGPYTLKDQELVQVGPLTFAVSILGAPAAQAKPAPAAVKPASPDDISGDDIDSWLISDSANPTPDRPSGVYGGDTITIAAFKDAADSKSAPGPKPPAPEPEAEEEESDEEYERLSGDDEENNEENEEDEDESETEEEAGPEEFIDESNPFHVKKKTAEPEAGPAKPVYKNTSDAASEILRRMMEKRRASRQ
jgi:pSer/pThr/pTyr-binding forkhead associated (FHA) protein